MHSRLRRFLVASSCLLLAVSVGSARQTPSPETQRGIELYQQGRADDAIAALKLAVKQNDKDADAWHFLGLALFDRNKLKDAQKALERAVTLRPGFPASHSGLAYVLLKLEKLDGATTEAKRTLELEPANARAHYVLGSVNLRRNQLGAALIEAEAAIKADPKMGPALLLKCDALLRQYDQDTADTGSRSAAPRYRLLKEAGLTLQTFFQNFPDARGTDHWRELNKMLQGYLTYPDTLDDTADRVFSAAEVTTKIRMLDKPIPSYPEYDRIGGAQGLVRIRATFGRDGRVRDLVVLTSPTQGLADVSLQAAHRIKFLPATINGHPVSQISEVEYTFSILGG